MDAVRTLAGRYELVEVIGRHVQRHVVHLLSAVGITGDLEQVTALRACNLVALPLDDAGVRRDLLNAVSGKRLSPVLVVSTGDGGDIADGYHRVSLAYHLDPFGDVPLRIGAAPS